MAGKYRVLLHEVPSRYGGGLMVIVADEEIVGRTFYDEERSIRLEVPGKLVEGDLLSEERVIELLIAGEILILYGERVVSLAVQMGLVNEDTILYVEGVPHVQVFKFRVA